MNQATFFRLLECDDKAATLEVAVSRLREGDPAPRGVHVVAPESFRLVPGSPFAYWVSDSVRSMFQTLPKFASSGRTVKQGLATADDFRFVRAWWEVPSVETLSSERLSASKLDNLPARCAEQSWAGARWFPFAKGGAFSPFYGDIFLVVNWLHDGREMKAWADPLYGNSGWSRILKSVDFYFRPGYTYPLRTSRLCPQVMPTGSIISVRGSGIYGDTSGVFLALLSSRPFDYLIKMILGRVGHPQFDMGDINVTPVPNIPGVDGKRLAMLALRCVQLKREIDTMAEETHLFMGPAVLPRSARSIREAAVNWLQHTQSTDAEVDRCQADIDDIAFGLYRFTDQDRRGMEAAASTNLTDRIGRENEDPKPDSSSFLSVAAGFLSYAIGCAFARWDILYATGEKAAPELRDPFVPLPVCPPGMLQNEQGLPARPEDVPAAYPVRIPWDGILVDDPHHPLDIERRVRKVIEVIWKDRAEAIEHEACELLGVKSQREYFRKPAAFFADHLKRYSKSRRQAPIYWPLSTTSGSYTLWIYYHRLTDQTLYACVNGFVQPKLNDLEREIPRLRDEKRTKELQDAVALQSELEEFKQELLAWAPRWKPNLNDGVLIAGCPLWKLFRLPKWRKDLEACWKKLEAGDYDWAHLAYTLWPARVREKCKEDRSLAIAHGLEEICQVEPPQTKTGRRGRRSKNEAAPQMELGSNGDSEA